MKQDVTRWMHGATYWDRTGHRRRKVIRVTGLIGALVGLAASGLGAALPNRIGGTWLILLASGAAVAGLSAGTLVHSWELLIRSPSSSGRWLQVESFRLFLHHSEAHHVEQAAELGVLREYTAWPSLSTRPIAGPSPLRRQIGPTRRCSRTQVPVSAATTGAISTMKSLLKLT